MINRIPDVPGYTENQYPDKRLFTGLGFGIEQVFL